LLAKSLGQLKQEFLLAECIPDVNVNSIKAMTVKMTQRQKVRMTQCTLVDVKIQINLKDSSKKAKYEHGLKWTEKQTSKIRLTKTTAYSFCKLIFC